MERMGYAEVPYVAVRHKDTEHDHVHIVASRVRPDEKVVSDSFEMYRSQEIMRDFEERLSLTKVRSSWEVKRQRKSQNEYHYTKRTGEKSTRESLRDDLQDALEISQDIPELAHHLRKKGVELVPRVTSDEQKITGVSFKKQGRRISGSRIHRDYAWPQLERHLGWNHARDYARLQRVPEPVPTSSEDENQSDEASDSGSMREDLRGPSFPPVERISEPGISPDLPASRPKKSHFSSSSEEPVPHTKAPPPSPVSPSSSPSRRTSAREIRADLSPASPEISARERARTRIRRVLERAPTSEGWTSWSAHLKRHEIEPIPAGVPSNPEMFRGILFESEGVRVPGDQVGRAYTWRRLRMQLGVHDPARDAEAFARVHVPGRGDLELHRRSLPPAEFPKAEPNSSESRGGSGAPPRARSAPEETPVSSKKSPELLKKEQRRPNFERERQRKKTRFVRQTRGAQDPSTRRSHQYMAELQRARQASPQARAAFEESLRQAKTQPNFERQHQRMKARFVRQIRNAKDPSTRRSHRYMAELQRARQASPQARAAFEESLRQAKTKPDFERKHRRMKARFVRQTRGAKDPSTRRSHQYMAEFQRARQASPQARAAFEESLRRAKTKPDFERPHRLMKARFVRQTRGAKDPSTRRSHPYMAELQRARRASPQARAAFEESLRQAKTQPNFERQHRRMKARFVRQTRGAQDPSTRRSHPYMAELQRARQASPQARAAFEESLRQAKTKPDFERQHRRMKARFVRQTRSAKDPSMRQSRRHILALQRARGAAPESPSAFEARAPEPVMTREDILTYRHQRRAEGKRLEARPEQAQGRWQGTFKDDRGQRWGRIEREDLEVWVRLRNDDEHGRELEVGTYVEARGAELATLRERSEPVMTREDILAYRHQRRTEGKRLEARPEQAQGRWQGTFKDDRGQRWGRIEREDLEVWVRLRNDDEHGRELEVGTYVEARGAKIATLRERSEPVMTREDILAYRHQRRSEGKRLEARPEQAQGRWQGTFKDDRGQRWGRIEKDRVEFWVRLDGDHQARTIEPGTPVHVQGRDSPTITPRRDRAEPSKSHLDVRAHTRQAPSPRTSSPEQGDAKSRVRSQTRGGPASGDERSPTQRARANERGEPPAPKHRPSLEDWLEDQKGQVRHLQPGVRTEGRVSEQPIYLKEGRYYTLETDEHERFLLKGNIRLDKQRGERVSVFNRPDGYSLVRDLDRDRDR